MSKTRIIGQDTSLTASNIAFVPDGSIAATNVQAAIVEVRDEGSGVTFRGARAYNSVVQSHTSGTGDTHVAATFDSEEYDTDAIHSTASNTSRMTVPAGMAGYWRFRGHAFFQANATGIRSVCLMKNGTKVTGSATRTLSPGSTGGVSIWAESTLLLAVADYIELGIYQNSGSTLNVGHATLLEIQTLLECEYSGS